VPFLFKGIPLFLFLYRMWKRLPTKQRRQVLWMLSRHGPRIATSTWRRARAKA
jgi:hypothetical protein